MDCAGIASTRRLKRRAMSLSQEHDKIESMQLSAEQQGFLLDLARGVIRANLRGESPAAVPPSLDPVMAAPGGCFVSLHDRFSHRLRGCVGRLQSPDPLLRNVSESAASVLGDPRFRAMPVTLAELPRLEIEISVLSPMKPAAHPLDFDLAGDGIYLQLAGRAGTFLP